MRKTENLYFTRIGHIRNQLSLLIILMATMTACLPLVHRLPSNTATKSNTNTTIEIQITNTPTPHAPRIQSPTLLLTSTLPPSQTAIPSWTPVLTLSNTQAELKLQEWLNGNPDCLLPCWGGITPNVTKWEEAKMILSSVVIFDSVHENIECNFGACNGISWHTHGDTNILGYTYSQSTNFIKLNVIEGYNGIPNYRLDKIFTRYGLPDKAFISTYSTVMQPTNVQFDLILSYPNNRFVIMYTWKAMINGKNVVSCIQEGDYTYLFIEDLEKWTNESVKNRVYSGRDINTIPFKQLEEVTNWTIKDFYDKFKDINGDECIITPLQYWP